MGALSDMEGCRPRKAEGMERTIRKIDLMHQKFGVKEGYKCRDCNHLVSGRYHDKVLHKCSVYGMTHSEASDWRLKYTACGLFGCATDVSNIIQCVKRKPLRNEKDTPIELDGQMQIFGIEISLKGGNG